MPRETSVRVVRELARRGYNAEREAVTLIAAAPDPEAAVERAVEAAPGDAAVLRAADVRPVLDDPTDPEPDPSVSTGATPPESGDRREPSPAETRGSEAGEQESADRQPGGDGAVGQSGDGPSGRSGDGDPATESQAAGPSAGTGAPASGAASERGAGSAATPGSGDAERGPATPGGGDAERDPDTTGASHGRPAAERRGDGRDVDPSLRSVEVAGDVTGESTGTGAYEDFVSVFRDRYERLAAKLRSRVNHRPAGALQDLAGGTDAGMVGMVNDVRSTAGGHWLVELEDTSGVFPCLVLSDREISELVGELLLDEVIAVEGTLADDGGVLFVDAIHFPDVPRTNEPATADREVAAALISDLHVGSQEFLGEAWSRFADWLHTPEAAHVEYLLIAGDMVEGVGVYPGQEEELSVVDVYDQYERFSERLKEVPGDMEVVMIPGNHDAVRLAEPQPAFDEELRELMRAHDARIVGNPSTVTVEGVSVLLYHGVALDEVIAELPGERGSYEAPEAAMTQLLKKRHLAPQYGGKIRIAPEERDWLVIDEVPDVLHSGHVHKLGVGAYHGVRVVNSGCWQAQTAFQRSVGIEPDAGLAPVLELDTLDVTVHKFA